MNSKIDGQPQALTREGAKPRTRQWVKPDRLASRRARISFACGAIGIDLEASLAWLPGGPIALRPQETRLLAMLYQYDSRVVRSEAIINHLYGSVSTETGRTRLKSLVGDIRRRLGQDFAENLCTARGIGLILYTAGPMPDGQAQENCLANLPETAASFG